MTKEEEKIRYLNLLISMQSVINCIDLLKDTPYYNAKIKEYGNPFYIQLFKNINTNIPKIFKVDEKLAIGIVESIQSVAKLIASKDWDVLITLNKMCKEDFDFENYKLVELTEEEKKRGI